MVYFRFIKIKLKQIMLGAIALNLGICLSNISVQAQTKIAPSNSDSGLIIIADNSGSMAEVFKGDTKINGVKKAINEAMKNSDFDLINTGLLEIGGYCEVDTLVSPGLNNRQVIRQASNNINPRPYLDAATPIGESIYQAAKMLQKYPGDKQIILVSDGGANCQGEEEFPLSACDMVASLKNQGIDFSLKLIGYGVENDKQFQCIQDLSNGKDITYPQVDNPEDIPSEINPTPDNPFEKPKTFIEQLTEFLISFHGFLTALMAIFFIFWSKKKNSVDSNDGQIW
ncbi:MAG: VWA domain-containing protein [Crocosphaera sp.]